MKITKILLFFILLFVSTFTFAQGQPVHFSVQQKKVSPTELHIMFKGIINDGWHVYSTDLPAGGPISTSLTIEKAIGVKPIGKLIAKGREINLNDPVFSMKLRYFEKQVTFIQKYKITGKVYNIKGYLEYGSCNDESCMPPTDVEFDFKGNGPATLPDKEEAIETELTKKEAPQTVTIDNVDLPASEKKDSSFTPEAISDSAKALIVSPAQPMSVEKQWWTPVIKELKSFNQIPEDQSQSLWYIFVMGIVGGLVALLTPCVWPIIPMTVSFFLKRAKNDRKKGIRDAITYGISIIVIYMGLALFITAIFGPQRLNALATNAPFNIFFFLMLVVFAFSFFGCFEKKKQENGTKIQKKNKREE